MRESVPFIDLRRAHAELGADLAAAFERVVDSSGFILGEEVERFEEEFADYCGVGHCVGVASGTAALTLALLASGVRPRRRGDRPRAHLHRLGAGRGPRRRHAGVLRRRGRHGPDRRGRRPRRDQRADRGDPRRPPLRPGVRHEDAVRARAGPRPAPARGRRPGPRRDLSRAARRLARGAARASASTRARTSARSGTGARSPRTTRRSPAASASSATSASEPRASTSSWASTSGSTGSRPRS